MGSGDPLHVAPIARANLVTLADCLQRRPGDVDFLMMRAANDRLLGNYADARSTYQEALRYDRRPELYYELGSVELQLGHRDEALETLYQAVLFSRTYLASLSPDVVEALNARLRREAPHLAGH
jgi:tetratricopeptide (TPR) repeat protein